LRLARYFDTSPGFWLNLQSAYDLEVAQDKLSRVIEREVRLRMRLPDPRTAPAGETPPGQPAGCRRYP
jgi:plasmid maintenance system antidote protein VapI